MNIGMKKAKLNNKLVNVISKDEFYKKPEAYRNSGTAIEHKGLILPIIGKNEKRVGYYPASNLFDVVNYPSEETRHLYSADQVIDFGKVETIKDVLQNTKLISDIENQIIVNPENIFEPKITDQDEPSIKVLKEAVSAKKIDMNSYASRIPSFNNDIRILKHQKVSLDKLLMFCNAFDIECELTLRDANDGDVPNPIGKEISAILTKTDF